MNKIPVAVLGATGLVGQRLIVLLAEHPWFELAAVAASDQSVGKPYATAVKWRLPFEVPPVVRGMTVLPCDPGRVPAPVVFSALPGDVAGLVEEAFAQAGAVISSNASAHRMDADVPLVIPEVNPGHLELLPAQRAGRNWAGALLCNPNCSTIHLVLALKPLADAFGLKRVIVTTMQAASGAGYPGVPSLDLIDNVIPYIGGEEPKLETEPLKLLGKYGQGQIEFADFRLSAHCNRVPTRDGHLETVSVELASRASLADVVHALESFRAEPQQRELPMAPARPVIVRTEEDRPQVSLDRDADKGMATVVGRLRECKVLDYKFVLLGHNTQRGAAGGTLLNAELMYARGLLASPAPAQAAVEMQDLR